jgi:hypothetical protein
MECVVTESNASKSFVLMKDGEEILRTRFQAYKRMTSSSVCRTLKPKLCLSRNTDEFFEFLDKYFGTLSILSCKGPSAANVNIRNHIIACNFVNFCSYRVGSIIFGVQDHTFMVRFLINANNVAKLVSVYELNCDTSYLSDGIFPKSYEWNLCNVCLKKTTLHCSKCRTMYCSKTCQLLDACQHQYVCGICDD